MARCPSPGGICCSARSRPAPTLRTTWPQRLPPTVRPRSLVARPTSSTAWPRPSRSSSPSPFGRAIRTTDVLIARTHLVGGDPYSGSMVLRMDNVGIVVEDLEATVEFFRELGLELEGGGV